MKLLMHAAAVTLGAALSLPALAAELKIGVITSLSGPISAIGIPYQKGIQVAQLYRPTVAGHNVRVFVLDDASDPATAARNARKLVSEMGVDVLIGTSGVPGAQAIAGVARESKTPLVSPSPLTLAPEDQGWTVSVSQPFSLMVAAVVEKMKASGVKRVAFIGFSDALGDLAYDSLLKAARSAGIDVVANERYARGDTSVAGQILKIIAMRPDAVMTGNSGTPGALPYLALAERGYKGKIYGTHGLITADFVRIAGSAANGLVVPSGPVMVADQLPASNPVRKVGLEFLATYQKVQGSLPDDSFSANTFDAWLLIADAVTRVGAAAKSMEPGTPQFRQALRDAIVQTKDFAGTHGIFSFQPNEAYGLDQRAAVVIRLEHNKWKLVD